MKKKYDIVAGLGKYTDREGNEKTRNFRFGSIFVRDDGSPCIKIDAFPVGPDFTGWANCYEPRPVEGQAPPQSQQPPASHAGDDSIPF